MSWEPRGMGSNVSGFVPTWQSETYEVESNASEPLSLQWDRETCTAIKTVDHNLNLAD